MLAADFPLYSTGTIFEAGLLSKTMKPLLFDPLPNFLSMFGSLLLFAIYTYLCCLSLSSLLLNAFWRLTIKDLWELDKQGDDNSDSKVSFMDPV